MDEAGSSNTLSSIRRLGLARQRGDSDRHGQRRYVLHGAERYTVSANNATITRG